MADSDDESSVWDKYISTAPLHLAWPRLYNCPTETIKQLLNQGYQIKRGRFSKRENRRLEKNWHRFCRLFPHLNDPFVAFGLNYKPNVKMTKKQVKEFSLISQSNISYKKKRKYQKLKLIFRMGYKLEKRLICDIYSRCKKAFVYTAFNCNSRNDLSEEQFGDIIEELFERKEPVFAVSTKHNISPPVISAIKKKPLNHCAFRWKKEDDLMLEMCIERLCDNADPWSIPTCQIPWVQVEREMRTCGYDLIKHQLYKRWIRLNKDMVNFRHKSLFGS